MTDNPFDLAGRVAAITGSTRGTGVAIARTLLGLGASVVVSGRDSATVDAVVQELSTAHEGRVTGVAGEMTDAAYATSLVRSAIERFGRLDILVGNAGVQAPGTTRTVTDEDFERMWRVNLEGNQRLARAALDHMVPAGRGSIVFIASIAAFRASARFGSYALSKAALLALVRTIAVENGRHGVRANAITPGVIQTEMSKGVWTSAERLRAHNLRNPLGRLGQPEDIAGAVAFLASDASAYVNGHTLVVDGGISISMDPLMSTDDELEAGQLTTAEMRK